MKHALLYVPGLGDHRATGQRLAVELWRIYGVRTELVPMRWDDPEAFEIKLGRIVTRIDELTDEGYQVSLVGVSAGASAVINAYAVRQDVVHRVVCICGKLQHPETISQYTYQANPGFEESLALLPGSLLGLSTENRRHILSLRPLADKSVPPPDTLVPGAHNEVMFTRGHAFSIATAITLFSWRIVRFTKRG